MAAPRCCQVPGAGVADTIVSWTNSDKLTQENGILIVHVGQEKKDKKMEELSRARRVDTFEQ